MRSTIIEAVSDRVRIKYKTLKIVLGSKMGVEWLTPETDAVRSIRTNDTCGILYMNGIGVQIRQQLRRVTYKLDWTILTTIAKDGFNLSLLVAE